MDGVIVTWREASQELTRVIKLPSTSTSIAMEIHLKSNRKYIDSFMVDFAASYV